MKSLPDECYRNASLLTRPNAKEIDAGTLQTFLRYSTYSQKKCIIRTGNIRTGPSTASTVQLPVFLLHRLGDSFFTKNSFSSTFSGVQRYRSMDSKKNLPISSHANASHSESSIFSERKNLLCSSSSTHSFAVSKVSVRVFSNRYSAYKTWKSGQLFTFRNFTYILLSFSKNVS